MANPRPKTAHLYATMWRPGKSGNPAGKPKGTKHISSWIQELLENEQFKITLQDGTNFKGAPIKAILGALVVKAIDGDLKAMELLAKYGYSAKIDVGIQETPAPIYDGLSSSSREEA